MLFMQATPIYAQTHFNVQHYTTDNGLPHNIGYRIKQDSPGYIWIGTDDGLLSNYVIGIAEGNQGTLWVGSWKRGINCMKNDSVFTPQLSKKYLE